MIMEFMEESDLINWRKLVRNGRDFGKEIRVLPLIKLRQVGKRSQKTERVILK